MANYIITKKKRDKLREYCTHNQIVSEYFYDELPTTGQTRAKKDP